MMKGDIVTLAGLTNSTTGSVLLTGQFSQQGITTLVVPQGMKLKIYRFTASGNAITSQLLFTPNINTTTPTWYPLDQISMTSAGDNIHEYKSRPIIVYGELGTEAITVQYTQASVGGTLISLITELTDKNEEEE
jgi:hypothetical protein